MTLSTTIEDEPNSEYPDIRLRFSSTTDDLRVVDHSAMQLKRNISIAITQAEAEALIEQLEEVASE